MHIYIYTYTQLYVYIYIYTERERERERGIGPRYVAEGVGHFSPKSNNSRTAKAERRV